MVNLIKHLLDPKGLLFYNDEGDFSVGKSEFKVFYYTRAGDNIWTVKIEFYVKGDVASGAFCVVSHSFTLVHRRG